MLATVAPMRRVARMTVLAIATTSLVHAQRPPARQLSSAAATTPATPATRATPAATQTLRCPGFARPDSGGHSIARDDLLPPVPFVDGNDLLALVDRSPRFSLDPVYAPSDLVDVRTMQPTSARLCVPPHHQCLRRDAADAFRRLSAALAAVGHRPWIDSAFRGHDVQCSVFRMWAYRDRAGFCDAAHASALPGHSQHQLGTAIDLFTQSWASTGNRFRPGFGCTPGGRWLADHAHEFGFVLPYPLHVDFRRAGSECEPAREFVNAADPRTGFKHEPWHLRFVGVANAAAFREAWTRSGPGSFGEITLDQWLRERAHVEDAIDPPVCDGCNCAACATFHVSTQRSPGPCRRAALRYDTQGRIVASPSTPTIVDALTERAANGSAIIHVVLDVPEDSVTQPPFPSRAGVVSYAVGESVTSIAATSSRVARAFPALPVAWRVGVSADARTDWPWQAGLVGSLRLAGFNHVNARVAASSGRITVDIAVTGASSATAFRVALLRAPAEVVGVRVVRGTSGGSP